jgi:hypothetical protein
MGSWLDVWPTGALTTTQGLPSMPIRCLKPTDSAFWRLTMFEAGFRQVVKSVQIAGRDASNIRTWPEGCADRDPG